MSLGANKQALMGAAGSGGAAEDFYDYQIANSARFDGSSTYLTRTASGASTNSDKKAISVWYKRAGTTGNTGATYIMSCQQNKLAALFVNDGSTADNFGYYTDNGGQNGKSKFLQRDFSAWYHLVFLYDATLSTGVDRVKVYINGVHYTTADTTFWNIDNNGYPDSGTQIGFGMQSNENNIGRYQYNGSGYFNGYLADFIMIDGGTVPSISDFGETKNGVWVPKDPSGLTFGNNGCWLKFTNSSDFGEDFSGNNNDWTANNLATHDQMLDTPTFGSSNGGNFCTVNPIFRGTNTTTASYGSISEGNLKFQYNTSSTNTDGYCACTHKVPASGKWYWEYAIIGGGGNSGYNPGYGIADPNKELYASGDGGNKGFVNSIVYDNSVNKVFKARSEVTAYGGSRGSDNDVMGIAIDMDNGAFYVSKNGTWYDSGDPTSGASRTNAGATWTPASEYTAGAVPLACAGGGNQPITVANFGQEGTFGGTETAGGYSDTNGYGNFFSSVPSGYSAICSGALTIANAIDPAQTDDNFPMKLHNTWRYTGNGSERTIDTSALGNGFDVQFDLLLPRSDTYSQDPYWLNTSKGLFGASSNNYYTKSNSNAVQAQLPQYNFKSQSGADYVLTDGTWFNSGSTPVLNFGWRANGGTTSAGSGDLTSQHQVDPSGGFSIVTAVGDGGSGDKTVSHGLSTAPTCIISKNLDSTFNWDTYWAEGLTASTYGLRLNTGDAQLSGRWGTVNSSIMTCKDNYTWAGTDNYIYYCFTDIEGYIKTGVYVGNANTDGTFVYTGFKPAWLMVRYVGSGESWVVSNNLRSPFNPVERNIRMNSSNAESDSSTFEIDYLSNGFKARTTWEGYNGSGYNIVYLAFAENPFKYATAR